MMHNTTFTVYPLDCNYMKVDNIPMVHGGMMLLRMDRAAAELARKCLYKTDCDSALTVGVDNVVFHFGAKLGDIIRISVIPLAFGVKRMSFRVECHVEEWGGELKLMSSGIFHFCSFKNGQSHPHGIKND